MPSIAPQTPAALAREHQGEVSRGERFSFGEPFAEFVNRIRRGVLVHTRTG